ncbi:MAG: hypothetical protein RLZZ272_1021, partial [Actinomycetota bacterium]
AVGAGYGAELDVHLCADGVPVVVHDEDLVRVAGIHRRIEELSADDLANVRFPDGTLGVPTLAQVLAAMRSVPVMVEVKQRSRGVGRLEAAVAAAIDAHDGPVCVAGFNPLTIRWFARHRPSIVRLLTAQARPGPELPLLLRRRLLHPRVLARLAPHGLSFELAGLPSAATDAWRERGGTLVTWTVRSEADLAHARAAADNCIFEHVRP